MLKPVEHWLHRVQPRPSAQLRLLCFAHAGGGPAAFRTWAEALPADVELLAVRLPGRDSRLRESAYTDWSALIEELRRALDPVYARPFALFGHSLGAMIAYELTCRLVRDGLAPAQLLLAGCRAPHVARLVPALHDLPDAELVTGLQRFAGTPEEVLADRELLALFLPMLRADLELAETWPVSPPRPVPVPLVTFVGADDPMAPPEAVAGWSRYAQAGHTTCRLPGDHFFLHSARAAFLGLLNTHLTTCHPGTTS
jgi:medium-chain acyl-[acyl-carrier-protein] hydrolase